MSVAGAWPSLEKAASAAIQYLSASQPHAPDHSEFLTAEILTVERARQFQRGGIHCSTRPAASARSPILLKSDLVVGFAEC